MTTFLPLIVDVPACDMPRPGDGPNEPIVVEMRAQDGASFLVPLSPAAAQALVQLVLREPQEDVGASLAAAGLTASLRARR